MSKRSIDEQGKELNPGSAEKRFKNSEPKSSCQSKIHSEISSVEKFVVEDLELELFQGLPGSDCDGTGGFIWEAGIFLSEYLRSNRTALGLDSMHVVELGSGSGIAGIVAALCGAPRVVLTDLDQLIPHLKRNTGLCSGRFHGQVEVLPLNWDDNDASLQHQFDLVIGADLLYDSNSGACAGM